MILGGGDAEPGEEQNWEGVMLIWGREGSGAKLGEVDEWEGAMLGWGGVMLGWDRTGIKMGIRLGTVMR